MKISYQPKSLMYQIAMVSFLIPYIIRNTKILHISLIVSFASLFIWEYNLMKTIPNGKLTIDAIFWTIIFIGINVYLLIVGSDDE
jgi:hypothetical protein